MARRECFRPIIDAAEAAPKTERLPQRVYAALLEDPTPMIVGSMHSEEVVYREVALQWGQVPCRCVLEEDRAHAVLHETSQDFVRPLSFGRRRCFRFHQFTLSAEDAFSTMRALAEFAESTKARASEVVGEEAVRGSNLGGFQDVVDGRIPLMTSLREIFAQCVQMASALDASHVTDMTPPSSPRGDSDAFAAWMNVSGKGDFNILHNHGDSSYAAVLYVSTPPMCGLQASVYQDKGALLFRLSRGFGAKFMEPDEDAHVVQMSAPKDGDLTACETESMDGSVQYAKFQPQAGKLVVFPGWIPHSVTPHFDDADRVCYASNW